MASTVDDRSRTTRKGAWTFLAALSSPPLLMLAAGLLGLAATVYPSSLVWASLTAAVVLAPLVLLHARGALDPYSPLAFVAWFYAIPGFVVGGALVAFGFTPAWLLALIPNPAVTFVRTQQYLALGLAAFGGAFVLPWPAHAGQWLRARLPRAEWSPRDVLAPGLILLLLGVAMALYIFRLGIIGYQQVSFGRFTAASYYFSLTFMFGVVLLWSVVFRTASRWVVLGLVPLLLLTIPLNTVLAGNRGTPLAHVVAIGLAFAFSGRTVRARHIVLFGVMYVVSIGAGMLFGSTFRDTKVLQAIAAPPSKPAPASSLARPAPAAAATASAPVAVASPPPAPTKQAAGIGETNVTLTEQGQLASKAAVVITQRGARQNIEFIVRRVAERLEHVYMAAVIVGNYERLRPEEERLGVANNIWLWTVTGFIPRALWPGKPIVGDARVFASIYLGTDQTSPASSPMVDLLRNFGVVGILAGMALLGAVTRVVHVALVAGRVPPLWCVVVYYAVLSRLSFEGSYGLLLPDTMRVAFVAVIFCLAVEAWRQLANRVTATSPLH